MRVREARVQDRGAMVLALAAAFAGDPPLSWFIPDPPRREGLLRRYFSALVGRYDSEWVSEDGAGAALWRAPGRWPPGTAEQLAMLPAELRAFGRWPRRALAGQRALERRHPPEPHWYLDYIAVRPGAQGRGTGSALLAPVLARCDEDGVPAYLNAGSPRSRDLYRRHGFEATGEFRLPFGGPPLWRMWRAPRRPR